jgi:hypothetical protein
VERANAGPASKPVPAAPPLAPVPDNSFCKVEIQGTLVINDEKTPFTVLSPLLKKQPVVAAISADKVFLPLYLGKDKKWDETAKALRAKTVLATGTLRQQQVSVGGFKISGPPPTAEDFFPRYEYYLEVTSLKAAAPAPPVPPKDAGTAKLLKDLDSADPFVRAAAIDELGKRKAKEAIPRLIKILDDGTALIGSDNYVGLHAAHALQEITGQSFGQDEAAWQKWYANQKKTTDP